MILVVMGVAGAGKTTIGQALAMRLAARFVEGDDLHPLANRRKMEAGIPLTDRDRGPWLDALRARIGVEAERGGTAVFTCSCLRHDYRRRLRRPELEIRFVHLELDPDTAAERLRGRSGHFFDTRLLDSQFKTLEVPVDAIILDARRPPAEIVAEAVRRLDPGSSREPGRAELVTSRPTALFRVDATGPTTPLPHVWEHTVGSGRALHALRGDWQAQLRQARQELGFRRVRFHGLLSDEIGTLVRQEDALLYSFHNVDVICDALLDMDVRPFVELSFMPTAIASGDQTVFRYQGNVSPPNDMGAWTALIRRLCEHWIERYGREELRRWHFEVWNEPNLDEFWAGTRSDYFTLYRHTAHAIKEIDPDLRVGGPATARNKWIPEFLGFCERHDVPVDFVTTHHYPTDAFGSPGDDTETRLGKAARGVLREQAARARREAGAKPLYYTEWNSSSNSRDPLHDQPYAAAFVTKTVLEAAEIVQGYAFWTFTDIFDETYFPSLPFHGGFGLLNLHGIAKPSYRAFEALHGLGEKRLGVTGRHATVDAWAVRRGRDLTVILTNHALPRHPIGHEEVRVEVIGGRVPGKAYVQRIDDRNANGPAAWREMGAPEYPSRKQVEEILEASRLRRDPMEVGGSEGVLHLSVELPPHAVAVVTLEETCPPDGSSGPEAMGP